MFVLVVGAGRVGSSVATSALRAGHTVSVLDEDPLSHERLDVELGQSWEEAGGRFTIGTALEMDALIEAGIDEADVFIASTNGDNTNLVVSQIAQRRFSVPRVVARVLDPRRAAWYAEQGLQTICPTQIAIEQLEQAALAEAKDGIRGGVRFVLDRMCEQFKQERQSRHLERILRESLEGLKWPEKVAFMKAFCEHLRPQLPSDVVLPPPDQLAHQYQMVLDAYVRSMAEFKQALRRF